MLTKEPRRNGFRGGGPDRYLNKKITVAVISTGRSIDP
jgi:hypothetical protein